MFGLQTCKLFMSADNITSYTPVLYSAIPQATQALRGLQRLSSVKLIEAESMLQALLISQARWWVLSHLQLWCRVA